MYRAEPLNRNDSRWDPERIGLARDPGMAQQVVPLWGSRLFRAREILSMLILWSAQLSRGRREDEGGRFKKHRPAVSESMLQ